MLWHAQWPASRSTLKRRHRLSDKARFRQVRQEGTSHTHRLLILCCLANQENLSRCGFTVSKRIGKAVERNRARRRMSEAVRLLWDLIVPGWDMVWIARPGINDAQFSELESACARLLRRARLLRASDSAPLSPPSMPSATMPEPAGDREANRSGADPVL